MRKLIVIGLAAAAAACTNPASNNAAETNDANGAAPAPAPAPVDNAAAGDNAAAPAPAANYTARGFEPGWVLTVAGGQMAYSSQNGPNLTVQAPAQAPITNGFEFVTAQLTARFTNASCTEASGQAVPYTVQVTVAGQTLDGCGQ